MEIKKQLRNFIDENFLMSDSDNGFTDDQSFLNSGIVDSTGVLELVSFVEETFNIIVEDAELLPGNFDSLNNLTRYIQGKTEKIPVT